MSASHVLVFHIGKQLLSLSLESISEIFILSQITRIPVAPVFMRHVVSYRGLILPVVDLAPFLGHPIKATVTHKTAIAVHPGNQEPFIALVVDNMVSVTQTRMRDTGDSETPFFVEQEQVLPKGLFAWNISPARIERFILNQLNLGSRTLTSRKTGFSHEKK